jgi:hypothetical protein
MAMKCILCYLQGMPDYGLLLWRSSSSDLVVYTDTDWADCLDTRRSTSGYAMFLKDNLVSWSAKWQTVVTRSSAEAKYRTIANGVAEATWLRQLLHDLQTPPSRCTLVYYDNISVVYLSTNPVQHQRTNHVEIDLHFIREKVAIGQVRVLHVLTTRDNNLGSGFGSPTGFRPDGCGCNFTPMSPPTSDPNRIWFRHGFHFTPAGLPDT